MKYFTYHGFIYLRTNTGYWVCLDRKRDKYVNIVLIYEYTRSPISVYSYSYISFFIFTYLM